MAKMRRDEQFKHPVLDVTIGTRAVSLNRTYLGAAAAAGVAAAAAGMVAAAGGLAAMLAAAFAPTVAFAGKSARLIP